MRQRGRKSRSNLTVVPSTLPQRPEPPAELTEEQADEWTRIVASLPVNYFAPENYALLSQLVRHVSYGRFIAALIDETDQMTKDGLNRYGRLLKMHQREGMAIASLSTKLRLTVQSRLRPSTAASLAANAPTQRKPWDYDGSR
jgi:hypothetical protein